MSSRYQYVRNEANNRRQQDQNKLDLQTVYIKYMSVRNTFEQNILSYDDLYKQFPQHDIYYMRVMEVYYLMNHILVKKYGETHVYVPEHLDDPFMVLEGKCSHSCNQFTDSGSWKIVDINVMKDDPTVKSIKKLLLENERMMQNADKVCIILNNHFNNVLGIEKFHILTNIGFIGDIYVKGPSEKQQNSQFDLTKDKFKSHRSRCHCVGTQ